jgi:hypothetical protein
MKHLLSYSVIQPPEEISGDIHSFFKENRCDGFELFTLFDKVPDVYEDISPAVHLPYAIDWYRAWTRSSELSGYPDGSLDYITYGRTREEVVNNIRRGIDYASAIHPAYGVLHAGNTDVEQVMHRNYISDNRKVLEAFADMMNDVVSGYVHGEPPFTLAFENLWWSGLRLRDQWEYELLSDRLEFDNWSLCLDTGHLMNGLAGSYDERSAIDGVLEVIRGYSREMKDRISTMHFHYSASARYRQSFPEKDLMLDRGYEEVMRESYAHVNNIDQHLPFTDKKCLRIVEMINPDYLTHEMIGADIVSDFIKQRSVFD